MVATTIERRSAAAELRVASQRRIVGAAMKYGSEARVTMPDGQRVSERFAKFAFAGYVRSIAETRLNLQHDPAIVVASTAGANPRRGLLTLFDGPRELRLVAHLPAGDPFDEVLRMVEHGDVSETSVEFRALQERIEGGRRTVQEATLPAIGIVAAGAYGPVGKVEIRGRRAVQSKVLYNRLYDCACSGPQCSQAIFEPGSFRLGDEALAVAGEYQQPVASVSGGGLRLAVQDDGLSIDLDLPDPDEHQAVRMLIEASSVAPILARPLIDRRTAVSTEDGPVRRYTSAPVRAVILAASDQTTGWEPLEFEERRAPEPRPRRRFWL